MALVTSQPIETGIVELDTARVAGIVCPACEAELPIRRIQPGQTVLCEECGVTLEGKAGTPNRLEIRHEDSPNTEELAAVWRDWR